MKPSHTGSATLAHCADISAWTPIVVASRSSHAPVSMEDGDGDGDLDIVTFEIEQGALVYENINTGGFAEMPFVIDDQMGIDDTFYWYFADMNGDTMPDLVWYQEEAGVLAWQEN